MHKFSARRQQRLLEMIENILGIEKKNTETEKDNNPKLHGRTLTKQYQDTLYTGGSAKTA